MIYIAIALILLLLFGKIMNSMLPEVVSSEEQALRDGIPERDVYENEDDHITIRYQTGYEIDPLPTPPVFTLD